MRSISGLLKTIQALQSDGTGAYARGLFPSQRYHYYLPYQREDDNLYFTALIAFTLTELKNLIPIQDQAKAEEIISLAVRNYYKYKSLSGEDLYNFYQTNPPKPFPNGHLLKRFESSQLADDSDCTVMVYLSRNSSETEALWLKEQLNRNANRSQREIKETVEEHRGLRAYSVWLGPPSIPVSFDFCVLCNILYFVHYYQLPVSVQDMDSMRYLRSVLTRDEHFQNTYHTANTYPNTAIILYHIARLLAGFHISFLEDLREKIIFDCQRLIVQTTSSMEKVILSSSLLKLNAEPAVLINPDEVDVDSFSFFIAPMLAGKELPILSKLAKVNWFHIPFRSKAYNLTLLLEYQLLKNSK
ncbi:MAG: hypothetical protein J0L62_04965 [Bacteroidetes bacterium]|nr:hypothetical protein [Bacteroidota bacterium]